MSQQDGVFDLKDDNVEPAVIEYLSKVRMEAASTAVFSPQNISNGLSMDYVSADIYDDEPVISLDTLSPENVPVEKNDAINIDILEWFEKARKAILEKSPKSYDYNEQTFQYILSSMKVVSTRLNDAQSPLAKILAKYEEHAIGNSQLKQAHVVNDEWISSMYKLLHNNPNIKNVEDIKRWLKNRKQRLPSNFKQWFTYVTENEPTHAIFLNIVFQKEGNIWALIQYFTQEWIKQMAKYKKPEVSTRLAQWLFYIFLHLHAKLTAAQVSNIRFLAKKLVAFGINEGMASPYLTEETGRLQISDPNISICQLVLNVIATKYSQHDLLLEVNNGDI